MHILIADDDPGTRLLVSAAVEGLGHQSTVAADGDEAWRLFQQVRPDAVITDWDMPGLDGTELTRRVREQEDVPYPYVIVLTARADEGAALRTMQAGADDFVSKPLRREDLERKLVAAERVTGLHRRLHRDARQDSLTGLSNRRRLDEDLAAIQARAQRYGHHWCVAMLDLDDFKRYNDALGHPEGDAVLRRVARALTEALRSGDQLYRFGGEEFLVLLPEQTLNSATLAADRLRRVVEALDIPHPDGGRVTVSAGLAGPTGGGATLDQLVGQADEALYAAKAAGRNRVEAAQAPQDGAAAIRLMLADDDEVIRMLISAIAEREPGLQLVGMATDAAEAIDMALRTRPDVVVLDVDMPGGGGVHAATEIHRRLPAARIIGLSADDSQAAMLDMGRAGAVGFIVKGAPPAEIVSAIRSSARY